MSCVSLENNNNNNNNELEKDTISELLSGDIESLSKIFSNEDIYSDILLAKKENEQILIETAAIGQSFSGKKIDVDSTFAVDSDLIINVSKNISSLDWQFSQVRKSETIKAKLTDNQDLFFSDIIDMAEQLEAWTERLDSIDEIILEESDKDLLVKYHASILESIRLDKELRELTKDLNIIMESLR